jgi:hypothetical protein
VTAAYIVQFQQQFDIRLWLPHALAANERLSPQGWHDLVRVMAARGAVATEDELNQIAAYLAKSFPNRSTKEDK